MLPGVSRPKEFGATQYCQEVSCSLEAWKTRYSNRYYSPGITTNIHKSYDLEKTDVEALATLQY